MVRPFSHNHTVPYFAEKNTDFSSTQNAAGVSPGGACIIQLIRLFVPFQTLRVLRRKRPLFFVTSPPACPAGNTHQFRSASGCVNSHFALLKLQVHSIVFSKSVALTNFSLKIFISFSPYSAKNKNHCKSFVYNGSFYVIQNNFV